MTVKNTINLLQPELLPKRHLLTLQNTAIAWLVVLVTTLSTGVFYSWQAQQLQAQSKQLTKEKRQLAQTMETLQAQIAKHKVSSNLLAKREQLKLVMTNKNALLAQLTDSQKTEVVGFAQAMTELANFHSRDISLERAVFNTNHISFSGLAKSPDAVPQWLSGFENSKLLSGQHFNHFQLAESDNRLTKFSVSSTVESAIGSAGELK
ncbi:hypothetical protein LP316_05425 [Thalassotalea sp. LPB0316]|uniref:PilN domain-containing protein n=1 Tax=Thalassotalea sp. LPB0316 TaxID=2769490 RepID=UPI0018687C05|nr:PilN domain-containing protein [Thalassotalea sp. LPB0316]QOL26740.1 hypothetical protein LP316_05425 [Thalassotalea sp. LPB0316]